MKHSYPTMERLKFLLELIHNKEMALPDFQRDFVWDPYATDELIESIISNYPAGTLLRINNGKQLLFQPREFEGAPKLDGASPAYLILDGQQRLTSLYQAFYGTGEHRFYLDLASLEKGTDLEDCSIYFRAEEGEKKYGTIQKQASQLLFPMARLFGQPGGFDAWQNEVLECVQGDAQAVRDLLRRLTEMHTKWIQPIEEYEFPMVTLNADTPGAAVCMIFETLNRTGIKLGVFDLLTARFWPLDFNLRQQWEDAKENFSIIEEYDIDPYYVLQIISLLEPGVDKAGTPRAPAIKRNSILNMNVEQARKGWDAAIEGLAETLTLLRDDCGVLTHGLLPYNTIVIPMAAAWYRQMEIKGAQSGANRLKIIRWFWCSVFGQKYENSPNSQAEKDFPELIRWMNGGEEPESVEGFVLEINLREVKPRQRAVYRGVMSLILHNGALDFHKRGKITAQLIADKKNPIDDHHIFPRGYLDELKISPRLRDCIINRTYIDRQTNRRLRKRSPADYFGEIRSLQGKADTDKLLHSHLLPTGDTTPLLRNEFEEYLDWREQQLLGLIKEETMK